LAHPNQVGLVGISAEDQNIRSSYLYQYSLGIQRRLGSAFPLEVDYQGSTGHKLGLFTTRTSNCLRSKISPSAQPGTKHTDLPDPFFGSIGTGKDLGIRANNGAVVTARYQGRSGIFLKGSYTLGKSLDYGSSFFWLDR